MEYQGGSNPITPNPNRLFSNGDRVRLLVNLIGFSVGDTGTIVNHQGSIIEIKMDKVIDDQPHSRYVEVTTPEIEPLQTGVTLSDQNKFPTSVIAEILNFEEMTPQEQQERLRLEQIVERSFVEAGRALKKLRDEQLYRSTHKTFEQYCRDRFGYNRSRSYQLIDAAVVVDNLQKCPQFVDILPTRESQVRPLTSLAPKEQVEAWQQAIQQVKRKVPPARIVKDVVHQIQQQNRPPKPWEEGEVAEFIVKNKDFLGNKGGCWAIIVAVRSFSCTVRMWDGEHQVKTENLKPLNLSLEQQREVYSLCYRLNRLARIEALDPTVKVLLASLGKRISITPVEQKLLTVLEDYYQGLGLKIETNN